MRNPRRFVVGSALSLATIGVGSLVAFAAPTRSGTTSASTTSTTTTTVSKTKKTATTSPVTKPSAKFVGSIAKPAAVTGKTYASVLKSVATETRTKAIKAAHGVATGTASHVKLITDHGYVVWRVIITNSKGKQTEVIVDAGNGAVLAKYSATMKGAFLGPK